MRTTRALLASLFSRVNLLAWAVLALALGATLLAWYNLRQSQTESATRQFELLTEELSRAIVKRMEEQESILLGAAGLLDAARSHWEAEGLAELGQTIAEAGLPDHVVRARRALRQRHEVPVEAVVQQRGAADLGDGHRRFAGEEVGGGARGGHRRRMRPQFV